MKVMTEIGKTSFRLSIDVGAESENDLAMIIKHNHDKSY